MKKSISLSIVVILLSISFVGCQEGFLAISGEGDIVTQEIEISEFEAVELAGKFDVEISYGDGYSMNVEGHQNIIDRLELDYSNGDLEIKLKRGNYRNIDMKIFLTVPDIQGVKLSGSGDIIFNKFENLGVLNISISGSGNIFSNDTVFAQTTDFNISGSGDIDFLLEGEKVYSTISGSGNVNLAGMCNSHEITISGSGSYNCFNFITENTGITISGSGDCSVFVNSLLDISISGSGDVYYKGEPQINSNISGLGGFHNSN